MKKAFADLDEVARCFKMNNAHAPDLSVKDLAAIAAKDSKNRFEFLDIREGSKMEARGLKLWPFKMRAAAGQSRHGIKKAEDNYRSAEIIYCSPSLKPEAKAPFTGKPVARLEDVPVYQFLPFIEPGQLAGRGFSMRA